MHEKNIGGWIETDGSCFFNSSHEIELIQEATGIILKNMIKTFRNAIKSASKYILAKMKVEIDSIEKIIKLRE